MSIFRALSLAALVAAAPATLVAQGKLGLGGKSQKDFEKIIKEQPTNPAGHLGLAYVYWNAKKWDDVRSELNAALALDPRFAPAHLTLAMIPYAQNPRLWSEISSNAGVPGNLAEEVARSDEHYRMAFFSNPGVDLNIIATVTGNISGNDMATGITACNEGRYDVCHTSMETYWAKNKGTAVGVKVIPRASYWYNALSLIHDNDFSAAASNLGVLASRPDDDTRPLTDSDLARIPLSSKDMDFMTGVVQFKLSKNMPDAQNILKRIIDGGYTHYMAHVYLADVYEAGRNYPLALEQREAAMKANTTDPLLHYEYGVTLAKAGQIPNAISHLTTATEKLPNFGMAWYYLALAQENSGDKAAAKTSYTKAAATANPADPIQAAMANAAKQKAGSL